LEGHPVTRDWLRAMLVATGAMSETGLTFKAGLRTHRPCRGLTVAGIDDNGLDAWCEPGPLSRTGEAEALLAGRATWDLYAGNALTWRTASAVRHRPAGDDHRPVLAAHRCGDPLPAAWLAPPSPRPATAPTTEGMPF
jgi:hypothetical protein